MISTAKPFYMLPAMLLAILCSSLCGQTVIADSTFDPGDWSVTVVTELGASETHEQRLGGGNPGAFRYMEHILPRPPGDNDLARIEVTHIYETNPYLSVILDIDHIDYAEDFRLLNLSWEQAFIVSYPALRQSGKLYRATAFLSVIADTSWQNGSIAGLQANDFIAIDGSGAHPDFSSGGDFIYFGFWRTSTRSGLLPAIPANQDLVYQHGSDNFTVTIHTAPGANTAPIARKDGYLYLDYYVNAPKALPVLENDSDSDGDPIRILSVDEPAFGGTIASFDDKTITYSVESPLRLEPESDFFTYRITDGQDSSAPAFVNIYFCVCPIECIVLFLTPAQRQNGQATAKMAGGVYAADSLDIDLFRQFRDEILLTSGTGTRFVDFYYHAAQELMPLLIFERTDLGFRAMGALKMLQEPLRDLIEKNGDAIISQALVDSVSAFLEALKSATSDSLRDSLDVDLALLGPLQALVGLPTAQAVEKALGDSVTTSVGNRKTREPEGFILRQSYPNPFNPATKIGFALPQAAEAEITIFDISGRQVRMLTKGIFPAGRHEISWDATDQKGIQVSAGIYFYRLNVHTKAGLIFSASKKLVFVK